MEITIQLKFDDLNEAKQALSSMKLEGEVTDSEFKLTEAMLEILRKKGIVDSNLALYADDISTAILQDPEFSEKAKNYYVYVRGLPVDRVKSAMNQGIAASGRYLVRTDALRKIGRPGWYKYYLA